MCVDPAGVRWARAGRADINAKRCSGRSVCFSFTPFFLLPSPSPRLHRHASMQTSMTIRRPMMAGRRAVSGLDANTTFGVGGDILPVVRPPPRAPARAHATPTTAALDARHQPGAHHARNQGRRAAREAVAGRRSSSVASPRSRSQACPRCLPFAAPEPACGTFTAALWKWGKWLGVWLPHEGVEGARAPSETPPHPLDPSSHSSPRPAAPPPLSPAPAPLNGAPASTLPPTWTAPCPPTTGSTP